jgi:thiosulfate/3-mercaptopyruvate sulfurtransferase
MSTTTTQSPFITPAELAAKMATEKVVPIDVRDTEEFEAGHLPGAVNIPEIFYYLATTDPAGLAAFEEKFVAAFAAAGLTGEETAILYETGYSLKAPRGYWILDYLGYPKKAVLQTGFTGWVAAGQPVSTEPAETKSTPFPVSIDRSVIATKEEVLGSLNAPEIIKLDCRDREEWVSESSSPYGIDFAPRQGRIPGPRGWIGACC